MSNDKSSSIQPKMAIAKAAEFLDISVQAVHKQLKLKNIVCKKIANKSFLTFQEARDLLGLKFKKTIIAGQIVKGGTGKTTSIDNIASCVNAFGARVLKIDADPQGNLTDCNDVDAEKYPVLIDVVKKDASIKDAIVNICNGIDLIPSRIENVILDNVLVNDRFLLDRFYEQLLGDLVNDYDYIFIDCPPTMGQSVTAASLYSDIILAPLNPDSFSAKGLKILKQEIDTLNKHYEKNIQYKVYLNKYSPKTILSDKAIMSLVSAPELTGKVLHTTIQFAQEIPNTSDIKRNLFSTLKKSVAREDFERLTIELLELKQCIQTKESASKEEINLNATHSKKIFEEVE